MGEPSVSGEPGMIAMSTDSINGDSLCCDGLFVRVLVTLLFDVRRLLRRRVQTELGNSGATSVTLASEGLFGMSSHNGVSGFMLSRVTLFLKISTP